MQSVLADDILPSEYGLPLAIAQDYPFSYPPLSRSRRYLRGKRDTLAAWHGKKIAGVKLVTDGRTLAAIEPALSEFSLYRAFNGGAA